MGGVQNMQELLKRRRQKLGASIKDNSLVIILSGAAPVTSGDQHYEYTPHRHFYYLTHIDRPKMVYVLKKLNGVVEDYLFIEQVSKLEEKWSGNRLTKAEAKEKSGIEQVSASSELQKILGGWLLHEELEHAYFDLERGTYEHQDTAQISFAKELQKQYPFLQVKNIYQTITNQRLIKSEEEIANIRTAIDKTRIGIEQMMKVSKPGLFEYQLEAHYNFAIKTEGVKKTSFHTIAASGSNATILHYENNDQVCQDGELILFDLGCEWNYYCSDISRTFPVNGKFTSRQREVYQAVLDVQVAVIDMIKPGVTFAELNQFAKASLATACQKLGLIEKEEDVIRYYYHKIGHYLGLDTHDVGGRGGTLQSGMVITVEPGLYISEEGIGIRIEDDILVTETGSENLSAGIIKSIAEIEAFMAGSK